MCFLKVCSVLFIVYVSMVECQRYIVPEATLELLSPRGLKISIPDDDPGISLVAFHININKDFDSLEHGQWAQDIIKRRAGRWTYTVPDLRVKQGDIIYYWVYVIVDGLGYQALDKSYKVTQRNPPGGDSTPTIPLPPRPTPPISITQPDKSCQLSITSRNGGLNTCSQELLMEESFNNLDGWSHQVQIGGNEPEDEFTVFTNDPAVSYTENGNLIIRPKLLEEKYNEEFVERGTLTMAGCTSPAPEQCSKTAVSYLILPPVMGARLNTKGSFSFRYGVLEIRAKLPKGDWIVPELWLEPLRDSSTGTRAGRVVLAMSRGNTPNNRELEAGVIVASGPQLGRKLQDAGWYQDFHTFKLIWTQNVMEFFVDGDLITRLPSDGGAIEPSINSVQVAPFNKEYYITLGLHVAGRSDFLDDMPNKPWKNTNPKRLVSFWAAKDAWKRSWNQDAVLKIQSIKVTAL